MSIAPHHHLSFAVDRQDDGRRTVVAVGGELDLATAPELRACVEAALAEGVRDLCVDLSRTSFMDSSGLHLLARIEAEVRQRGGRLAIVCVPGPVLRVIELTGVAASLPLHVDA